MHRALKSETARACFAAESKDLAFLDLLFSPYLWNDDDVQLCNVDGARPCMWKIEYSPSQLPEIQQISPPLTPEETCQDCENGQRGVFSMLGIPWVPPRPSCKLVWLLWVVSDICVINWWSTFENSVWRFLTMAYLWYKTIFVLKENFPIAAVCNVSLGPTVFAEGKYLS